MEKQINIWNSKEDRYGFQIRKERTIYNVLWKRKGLLNIFLPKELRFEEYLDWKKYVRKKYSDYNSKKLINFYAYLQNGVRTYEAGDSVFLIFVTSWCSVFLTLIFKEKIVPIVDPNTNWGALLIIILGIAIVIAVGVIIFLTIIQFGISKANYRNALYIEYQKIIAEMIKEKKKNKKKKK